MSMPQVGDPAPDFEVLDDRGELVRLSDFRGQKVILFFYPRADTPGCTVEACAFRDDFSAYETRQVAILGISPDSVIDEAKFKEKFDLPFPLLADEDHRIAERYGTWQTRRSGMGVVRTTFLIDENGTITNVFEKVDPEGHSQALLNLLPEGER